MDRYESVMEGAAIWGAFYRANPDKFAEDYLHIQLKLFQRILLTMMFWSTTFVLIAWVSFWLVEMLVLVVTK